MLRVCGGQFAPESGGQFRPEWVVSLRRIGVVTFIRISTTLWQHPEYYKRESAVLLADNVTTPLLIVHNKQDQAVQWEQGVEWYMALWRLKKPSWLLEYDGEGHDLSDPKNRQDYSIRLTQFFDHYLKGAPAPKWMTDGISYWEKGRKLGYELDFSNKKP